MVVAVESKFLSNNFERFSGHFTFDGPVQDIIGNLVEAVGQYFGGNIFLDVLWRLLVLIPPASKRQSRFLLHGKPILCNGFIISKWAQSDREKLSPFV